MWEFIKFTVQTLNAQLSERLTNHQRVGFQSRVGTLIDTDHQRVGFPSMVGTLIDTVSLR